MVKLFRDVTENEEIDTCSAPAGVEEVEEVGWSPVSSRGFHTGDPEKRKNVKISILLKHWKEFFFVNE